MLFVPHLYEVQNYSVLVMESISSILVFSELIKLDVLKERTVQ